MPSKKKKGKAKAKAKAEQQQQPQTSSATPDYAQVPLRASDVDPEDGKPSTSGEIKVAESEKDVHTGKPSTSRETKVESRKDVYTGTPSTSQETKAAESGKDVCARKPSTSRETKVIESKKGVHVSPETLSLYLEKSLTLSTPLVKRPDHGSRGRKIALTVNYFPVELPSGNVYHYDVEINLVRRDQKEGASAAELESKKFRCLNTKKNREVIRIMFSNNREFRGYIPAYDGEKNLYTKTPLKSAPLKKIVELESNQGGGYAGEVLSRGDVFEVSIKPVIKKETNNNAISLDMVHALYEKKVNHVALEAIMAIETILRNGPCSRYVPIRRSFFYPPQSRNDVCPLSGGKEIWFGHHQSLILTERKPVVNINVTATTFRKSQPLLDYICEILECSENDLRSSAGLRDANIVQLSRKLKGVKITVTHLRYEREYRVLRMTRESARELRFFMNASGREISVLDYFSQNHDITLRYPHLPCLQVRPEERRIYLPLEVCKIAPEQHSNERLTETQTREMIRVASLPPDARFRKIKEVLSHMQFDRDPCNAQFGVKVSPDPLAVEGRVMEPPNVMYCDQRRVTPKDGSWEMKSEKFLRGAVVDSWVILSFINQRFCTENDMRTFADLLRDVGLDCGLTLGNLKSVDIFNGHNVKEALETTKRKFQDIKLALIVLQGKNSPLYPEIKQISETRLGLITQCVQSANVKKLNRSVIKNICLKINAKMDGINCSLTPGEKPAIFNKPVIIIGADVTHPAPGSGFRPSIAAVVASLDSYPSRYAVELRAQRHTRDKKQAIEIIDDLKNMVKNLLETFCKETRGRKPEKIIFYRDGVSKGEFERVRNKELNDIRKACLSLNADYKPGITFIIVQKRHHTRFFPQDPRQGVGPRRNVPPGTVVDKGVSSIIDFDFFLCSHFGLQGTSRPGHYTVVSDDNKFSSDEVQKLTYYLCYIYARCTRSISIPAPVAYANLAAYRASKYLAAQLGESSAASSEMSVAERQALLTSWADMIAVMPHLKTKLFFV